MRKYFIDYFQLWLPFAKAEMKDPEAKSRVKKYIIDKLFNDTIRMRMINKPHLSLESFFHLHFHHGGLILHIKGLYFDSDEFTENLTQIYHVLNAIYGSYKDDFDFTKMTVSRIDLACNIPLFLNTHEFSMHKSSDLLEETVWYIGEPKLLNMTGYVIGKRGKSGLRLSVYDKRYAPNHLDDHRFASYNYTRLEYKIGRRYLKDRLGLGTPKAFRIFEHQYPEQVIEYCTQRADIEFVQESTREAFWSESDFQDAVGRDVEDSTANPIRVVVNQ